MSRGRIYWFWDAAISFPGTTKLDLLKVNLGEANVQLTPDDLRAIDTAAAKIRMEGARHPED